jgi:protein-tyrosine-phosphatase
MAEPISRKSDELRRVLFLCDENYHESRFCEELFNSHARTESLNWQATSRAVLGEPAARNEGPMSLGAIEFLRKLGAAPVNHLRLPLEATHFDFQMSDVVIVLDIAWLTEIEKRWARHAHRIEYWSLPRGPERHSRAALLHLARDLSAYATSLNGHPKPLVGRAPSAARPCNV